jgi:DNA gyrase/topoisomerase IV subunit B
MTDTQRRPLGMRTKRSDATSMEVDKLRAYLTAMQQEVSTLREKATRAELAEAKVRVEMATTTVPSEVHEQAVSFFSYLLTTNFAEKHSRWMDLITAASSCAAHVGMLVNR